MMYEWHMPKFWVENEMPGWLMPKFWVENVAVSQLLPEFSFQNLSVVLLWLVWMMYAKNFKLKIKCLDSLCPNFELKM